MKTEEILRVLIVLTECDNTNNLAEAIVRLMEKDKDFASSLHIALFNHHL